MAKKKGGGLTPIDGGRKKGKPSSEVTRPPEPDILLPDKLAAAKVTAKALQKGSYQKKLLAFFAPVLLPELLNSIRRNLKISDTQTQKLAADIFGLTPKTGGFSINVNQQNVNSGGGRSVAEDGCGSFEDIARVLAERREKRAALPPAGSRIIEASVIATPEE